MACHGGVVAEHEAEGAVSVTTGVAGTVLGRAGEVLPGAFVYAYRSQRGGLRGPADFEAVVDAQGRYALDLVEGRYYLVARWRQGGLDAGPPRVGDAWALAPDNPVAVTAGHLTRTDFVLQQVAQPMLMRDGTLTGGDTGFVGLLQTADGIAVPGAFVMAYPDPDYRRMPEVTSPAVGADGRFRLFVPHSGRWCLAARTRTRGQLVQGELFGLLGEETAGCREVAAGEILDVGTIVLSPYRR